MKVVTTNLLNRFWKNGIKPIKEALTGKVDSSKIVNSLLATEAGFALDARQGKVLDDKLTELNGKSTQKVTVNIGGLSHVIRLTKIGKIVYCTISAAGSLAASRNEKTGVIPTNYCPINKAYFTTKNVTSANYAANYGTTRYEIAGSGDMVVVTNEICAVERHTSGCWITN